MRHLLGRMRWRVISGLHRREFRLPVDEPTVSFTFDDFPRSALHIGGAILKSYDVCGTYYAAMGLMDQVNEMGPQFCAEDLQKLLADGHELGSHTFSHLSCRTVSPETFQKDVTRGKKAVEQVTGELEQHHFSYPYGHATVWAKAKVGAGLSSCRGILPGINESLIDLNLLRANSLYSWRFDLDLVDRLLKANQKSRGWLIFYTHDVSERPSPFGCKPAELDAVVRFTVGTHGRVKPVSKVLEESREFQKANSRVLSPTPR